MTPEHEPGVEERRLRRGRSPGARTQECEQHGTRQQNVSGLLRATVDVASGGHNMQRHSDHQQAGGTDVYRLKAAVARPESRADGSPGRHGKKEQSQERQDPGVFVARGGQLEVLDDASIGAER